MGDFFERFRYSFLNGDTRRVLIEVVDLFLTLWPYLLAGIIISTLVKIYFTKDFIQRVLSGTGFLAILTAACLGIISPLGAYVTLPLIATFYSLGLPLAPLIAFAMASPIINPGIFLLTEGTLGMEMAVMRVVSALSLGLLAGFSVKWISKKYVGAFELRNMPESNRHESKLGDGKYTNKLFLYEFWRYTRYISKHFLLGIFIAAFVKVMIPSDIIMRFLGDGNLSVLFATGAGVPLYSCGGAALPVLQELLALGVGKGAILAFCISGPAIKMSSLVLLNTLFKKGVLYLYLLLTVVLAVLLGLMYQVISF